MQACQTSPQGAFFPQEIPLLLSADIGTVTPLPISPLCVGIEISLCVYSNTFSERSRGPFLRHFFLSLFSSCIVDHNRPLSPLPTASLSFFHSPVFAGGCALPSLPSAIFLSPGVDPLPFQFIRRYVYHPPCSLSLSLSFSSLLFALVGLNPFGPAPVRKTTLPFALAAPSSFMPLDF